MLCLLRRTFLLLAVSFIVLSASTTRAQTISPSNGELLLILPFDDTSRVPGLEWVGEAFSEILGMRMASPIMFTISREERNYAFEHLGIPNTIHPSKATIFRLAEEMDVDYVVMGSYNFDGRIFSAHAQLLDMKSLRMHPELSESGPLAQLMTIQSTVAWRLLRTMNPGLETSRDTFVAQSPAIPTEAFKNYIRGLLDPDARNKIIHFKEAVRLDPNSATAILQLGKTYFQAREYKSAAIWLEKIPSPDATASEARFFLGLSDFYLGEYDRAERAFKFVAATLPLTEVLNNLGVVEARRGQRSALDLFRKATIADPQDADYQFNLALASYRAGNRESALKHVKNSLELRASDSEAREFLALLKEGGSGTVASGPPAAANPALPSKSDIAKKGSEASEPLNAAVSPALPDVSPRQRKVPLERVKTNYDETSYRQLAMVIQNAREASLAGKDRKTQMSEHLKRGNAWLQDGDVESAQREFQEALSLDPANPKGHAGMAHVLAAKKDFFGAQSQARASVQSQPSADAYSTLALAELENHDLKSAEEDANRALALDPLSSEARDVKRKIESRKVEPPQPQQN